MTELGQESLEFSTLVSRAAEESYLSLKELIEKFKCADISDSEKKINILKYLVKTRQRMLRLNVLAQWCQQLPLIQYCQQLASTLSSQETCFTQAADSMFFMHEGLQQARAPIYDVPSAIEVLTGTYQRLPKCTEDVGIQSTLTERQQKHVLKKLDIIVRSKLLETTLPKEFSEVKIFDGTVTLSVPGEFKVLLTLGYRGHLSMWRILHLELLVGEKSGVVKFEETRRFVLGDDLERRMAASENPFAILYSILHEFCVALIMDTVIRQVRELRVGKWKDAIRFDLISYGNSGQQGSATGSLQMGQDGETDSAGLRTPGLKIVYWLDFNKNFGTSDSVSCPFIKIEPGPDLHIKCIHSSFVIDPVTNREAEFSIDQSCIDVEKLLLRAIYCNKYTLLLEIYKELGQNSLSCRDRGDVVLDCPIDQTGADYSKDDTLDSEGHVVLRIRAYGSSFFTLGINIRTGRFLLHSSKSTIASSALRECEEALNQGSMTAAEAFISLRSKSLLHLFACIGRFLGLQVYEHSFSPVKVPNHALNGSNMLLMGFPDCGSSYILLMQLEDDFRPVFKLLETQPDPSGKGGSSVARIKIVDINQMHLLDYNNFTSSEELSGPSRASDHGLLSFLTVQGSSLSDFSSLVDEIFEQERRSSASAYSTQSSSHGPGPITSNMDNSVNLTSAGSNWNGSLYPANNSCRGKVPSAPTSSMISRSTTMKKLPASKSDQDLASRSPQSTEVGTCITGGARVSASSARGNTFRNSVSTPAQTPDSPLTQVSRENGSRKRTLLDVLDLLPSLRSSDILEQSSKRRKLSHTTPTQKQLSNVSNIEKYRFVNLIAEANKGDAPSSIYVSALLHVVRHCSHCIKHARLTSQMDALGIPYAEEIGVTKASSNIWFKLPSQYFSPRNLTTHKKW
ncbi:hypothetical protein M8C21_030575 [Ambrosia artemisiifolia]|uniref:Mediator of RNA polymerase II transcription subunit 14 n=1 Tax=Ambrosia artemisiifolia TaxID=4212 RepID=A0AAD5CR82_AMBAR|nr:hypothetical protein M8C21_030575 [Ambrosia artemisiifolia]